MSGHSEAHAWTERSWWRASDCVRVPWEQAMWQWGAAGASSPPSASLPSSATASPPSSPSTSSVWPNQKTFPSTASSSSLLLAFYCLFMLLQVSSSAAEPSPHFPTHNGGSCVMFPPSTTTKPAAFYQPFQASSRSSAHQSVSTDSTRDRWHTFKHTQCSFTENAIFFLA